MKFKPILNHIIIRPDLSETEKTAEKAGIALPEKRNKEGGGVGTAIFVGPGKFNDAGIRIPCSIKEGDTVFYHKTFASPIVIGEDKYVAIKEDECQLAIEG